MAERKQKNSLRDLLNEVEKAHKSDIQLYTSGHLNHDKLYKPKEVIKRNYWESGRTSAFLLKKRPPLLPSIAFAERSRRTKNPSTNFRDEATPTPSGAKSVSHSCLQPRASKVSSRAAVSVSLGGSASQEPQSKEAIKKTAAKAGFSQKTLIREELDIPEMKMLKYKPTTNSRLCVMEGVEDEYQFLPSYLAGVTKMDQFHQFMRFQKNFIAKQDLLENDFIGRKTAEQHEKKLAQALQNVCDCNRPHFNRLQAVGDVFEDICNSSLIFGDILKEVKNEYELYMVILLDSLPTTQYRILQNEVKGMEKRTVKTHEIEEARHDIQVLVQKSKWALERNEELRNELEIELWVSQSAAEMAETELDQSEKKMPTEAPLSICEQLESLRLQIILKWDEIQAMKKEIKDTMTFAGIANIRERTVKELEVEAAKLAASNKFLRKQINDVENNIAVALKRQKVSQECQQHLWDLLKNFLVPEETEEMGDDIEDSNGDIFT